MRIEHWVPEPGSERDEQQLRKQLAALGYQVSRYVYPPGSRFPQHRHVTAKIEVVLEGHFRMTMEGETILLQPGQAIQVPEGVVHSAEVVGNQPVVSLDAVKVAR